MQRAVIYIRSTFDFAPWPDGVLRHHPPHWPEKTTPPDLVTRDVCSYFETADRIQYVLCAAKGDRYSYVK